MLVAADLAAVIIVVASTVIVVVAVVAVLGMYNGLVQRRLRIDEAFAQIDVQLKRRHDLIPNLVNAVQGYMGFEQKVLTDVTNARAAAVAAGAQGPAAQAQAENMLTGTLRSLFSVVESVDSLALATTLDRLAQQRSQPLDVLVEVNVGREASKSGFLPEELPAVFPGLWHCRVCAFAG